MDLHFRDLAIRGRKPDECIDGSHSLRSITERDERNYAHHSDLNMFSMCS